MTYLIVGGSSGLGRALAEVFACAGHSLVLLSSDERDSRAVAADLALRHGVQVRAVTCDLAAATLDYGAIEDALSGLPGLEGLLLAAGANRSDDEPGLSDQAFEAITRVNHGSICRLVNHFLPTLTAAGSGLLVGFGSIAAARGRSRNVAYSAAKRALESYFESLRHALAGSRVRVQFYVLGYLDTNLAFGQRTPLPPASPRRCAERVFLQRERDIGRTYYPGYWRLVVFVLRRVPWFLYRRMSF